MIGTVDRWTTFPLLVRAIAAWSVFAWALNPPLGGLIVDGPGARWIPVVAAIALALAWVSASFRTPQAVASAA